MSERSGRILAIGDELAALRARLEELDGVEVKLALHYLVIDVDGQRTAYNTGVDPRTAGELDRKDRHTIAAAMRATADRLDPQ